MFYLYTCFCHEFLVRVKSEFEELSEVPKFRVNSLSIVYHCAKHNLPTLITVPTRHYLRILCMRWGKNSWVNGWCGGKEQQEELNRIWRQRTGHG